MSVRSARVWAAVALIVIGSLGAVIGLALDRTVLSPCGGKAEAAKAGQGEQQHRTPYWARTSEEHRQRWEEMSRDLGLSPAQNASIDTIFSEQSLELEAVRGEFEPRMREVLRTTRQRIDTVLTAEQKSKIDEIRRERRARREKREQ
jgi:Spy/CpxP family protein refolding chaperone